MMVRVKLYARLERYLPKGAAERNEADMDVTRGTTVAEVLDGLGLPEEYCHLVLVNGHFLPPGERRTRALDAGDHLAVWPPVAGGVDKKDPATGAGEKSPAKGGIKTVITKEMGITHADFFRTLPAALDSRDFKRTDHGVVLDAGGKRLTVSLGPERMRQVAGLKV
ncbi:MAG TPA: MoaD/ThiS family protein, partial [Rhodospirillales bacterium]